MGEATDRWEDLVRLLCALSQEDIAAVQALAEELAERKGAVREAQTPYITPIETAEEVVQPNEQEYWAGHQPATPEEALDFLASGPPGFVPGELDQLLADIEQVRQMELETPCQPM